MTAPVGSINSDYEMTLDLYDAKKPFSEESMPRLLKDVMYREATKDIETIEKRFSDLSVRSPHTKQSEWTFSHTFTAGNILKLWFDDGAQSYGGIRVPERPTWSMVGTLVRKTAELYEKIFLREWQRRKHAIQGWEFGPCLSSRTAVEMPSDSWGSSQSERQPRKSIGLAPDGSHPLFLLALFGLRLATSSSSSRGDSSQEKSIWNTHSKYPRTTVRIELFANKEGFFRTEHALV